jgi:hypothetical protein
MSNWVCIGLWLMIVHSDVPFLETRRQPAVAL